MKKTFLALALLLGLELLSGWNLRHLQKLTDELCFGVEEARSLAQEGNFTAADEALARSLDRWLDADGYTHVFIRHSEIDAATDIFYDLRGSILAQETETVEAEAEKLLYHLRSIYTMERVSIRSVF